MKKKYRIYLITHREELEAYLVHDDFDTLGEAEIFITDKENIDLFHNHSEYTILPVFTKE